MATFIQLPEGILLMLFMCIIAEDGDKQILIHVMHTGHRVIL